MFGWNGSAWFAVLAGAALKSAVAVGLAWAVAFLLRGRSAAARHLVWTAAVAAMLALPILSVSLPDLPVLAPNALLAEASGAVFQTTVVAPGAPAAVGRGTAPAARAAGQPAWRLDWRAGAPGPGDKFVWQGQRCGPGLFPTCPQRRRQRPNGGSGAHLDGPRPRRR